MSLSDLNPPPETIPQSRAYLRSAGEYHFHITATMVGVQDRSQSKKGKANCSRQASKEIEADQVGCPVGFSGRFSTLCGHLHRCTKSQDVCPMKSAGRMIAAGTQIEPSRIIEAPVIFEGVDMDRVELGYRHSPTNTTCALTCRAVI
jgi:hypothetical protein